MTAGHEDRRADAQLDDQVADGDGVPFRSVPDLEQPGAKPAPLARRRRRRLIVGVLVAVLAVPATFSLQVGYAVWRNNSDMDAWRDEIYAVSEIEGAELVERGSRFGLQPMTNGNHCDREAWLVCRTDLDAAVIQAHFDSATWSSASDPGWVARRAFNESVADLVRVDFHLRFDPGSDVRCM